MEWSAILAVAALIAKIHASTLLDLTVAFTLVDGTGRIRVCNIATCWGTDNLLLVKEASSSFRCSVVVKSPEISLSDWYVPGALQLFVVDLGCPRTDQLLKEAESLGLFNDNVVWLVINSREGVVSSQMSPNESSALDAFKNVYVTVLSQVNIARQITPARFEITSVYRRNPGERIICENLGYWTKTEGLVFTAVGPPSARRVNTEGRLFRTAGVITDDDSLNHFHDLFNPDIDNPTKIYYVFWENIIQAMNGRMEFIVARKWGAVVNGSFNGMMGYIERNEVEILVSPLYISEERLKLLRYLAIGHSFRIKLLFLSPPLSYKNNIYLLPFSSGVWYSCILLFVVSVVLLYIVAHYEDARICENPTHRKTRIRALTKSWIELIMLNFGTICQQDLFMEPKGVCGRIIILHVKILVLFVTVFYSASILVLLQSSDRSITNLKALDESNFKIASDDTPYNRFYLKVLKDPVGRKLVAKMSNRTGFMKAEDGIKEVTNGFFAFHVNRGTGYIIVRKLLNERDKCRLQELDESLLPNSDPLMAVKRDLPYREMISIMFQRLYERGFIKLEGQRKSAGKPPCEHGHTSYVNIGVVECKGAFLLLLGAFLLSFLIFIGELFVHKRKMRKTTDSVLQYGYQIYSDAFPSRSAEIAAAAFESFGSLSADFQLI